MTGCPQIRSQKCESVFNQRFLKAANRLIEDYAHKKKNLMFIDVFTPMLGPEGEPRKELFESDGLHLNAKGYELWTSVIRPFLNKKPTRINTPPPLKAPKSTR